MLRRLPVCVAWALLLVAESWANPTFSFAIDPRYVPAETAMRWSGLLRRLEADTGLRFQLRVRDKAEVFEDELRRGVPDFAFLDPYHMVSAKAMHAYTPLVRGGRPLIGVLVVEAGGPIQTPSDLAGSRLAFPSPNAFAAIRG